MSLSTDARSLLSPAPSRRLHQVEAVWRLQLLGGFRLIDAHGVEQPPLRSRSATVLIAAIAMAPGRDHSREELITLLWPDVAAEIGRTRLRQTLRAVKALLEPPGGSPVVLADRRVLRVTPSALWCDVVGFEDACRAAATSAAQRLYMGELLPGFTNEWVVEARARLAGMRADLGPAAFHAHRAELPPEPTALHETAAELRLPAPLSKLFGTAVHEARLCELVDRHRRVVVVGAAGVGKTRLAIEVARRLAASDGEHSAPFDQAFFVSLQDAVGADGLRRRLHDLPFHRSSDGPAPRILVVLDQCGIVDHEAGRLLADVSDSLPSVHWLITSRRPLGLPAERVFALPPLPVPAPDASLAELASNPAVLLYVDRAKGRHAEFRLQAENGGAVAALVRWLDGLPLAIERAASHARIQGPAELLATFQEG